MKLKHLLTSLAVALSLGLSASAAEKKADGHGHTHEKKEAGPNGGRLLTAIDPHAEFLVLPDRKVQITFLGEDGKAVAPTEQVVTISAGDRSAPTKLTFVKSGNTLVSEAALPTGGSVPTVVQIKLTPEAKTVVERFNVNLSNCPGCSLAEYACTCGH